MSNISWMTLGIFMGVLLVIPLYVFSMKSLLKQYIHKGFIELDGELFLIIDGRRK